MAKTDIIKKMTGAKQGSVISKDTTEEKKSQPKRRQKTPRKTPEKTEKTVLSIDISDLKKKPIEFTGVRMKVDLYDKIKKIAANEGIKKPGNLIERVLSSYVDQYENTKGNL